MFPCAHAVGFTSVSWAIVTYCWSCGLPTLFLVGILRGSTVVGHHITYEHRSCFDEKERQVLLVVGPVFVPVRVLRPSDIEIIAVVFVVELRVNFAS